MEIRKALFNFQTFYQIENLLLLRSSKFVSVFWSSKILASCQSLKYKKAYVHVNEWLRLYFKWFRAFRNSFSLSISLFLVWLYRINVRFAPFCSKASSPPSKIYLLQFQETFSFTFILTNIIDVFIYTDLNCNFIWQSFIYFLLTNFLSRLS